MFTLHIHWASQTPGLKPFIYPDVFPVPTSGTRSGNMCVHAWGIRVRKTIIMAACIQRLQVQVKDTTRNTTIPDNPIAKFVQGDGTHQLVSPVY